MLLAWNYQNSAAVRNGTAGPDLTTMASLWEQYQNAIGVNNPTKLEDSIRSIVSSVNLFLFIFIKNLNVILCDTQSPTNSQDDRNSPSDTKEEDDGSDDESDEKTDRAYNPERLKAFNVS